jgi:hypothetical protein
MCSESDSLVIWGGVSLEELKTIDPDLVFLKTVCAFGLLFSFLALVVIYKDKFQGK